MDRAGFMLKRRYVPDAGGLVALCEGNYRRLNALVAVRDLALQQSRTLLLSSQGQSLGQVLLEVTARGRYTDTLSLQSSHGQGPWLSEPEFVVQVHHDARTAEVVQFNDHQRLQASHVYPNRHMYLPDEKHQVNSFFADWLRFCSRHRQRG